MPDGAKAPTAHPQVRAFILCLNTERARRDSTPNLLIRSNSIDPTEAEAARPQTKPRQLFAQVTGLRTRQGGAGRGVTELRSRGILGHILGHHGRLWAHPARPRFVYGSAYLGGSTFGP